MAEATGVLEAPHVLDFPYTRVDVSYPLHRYFLWAKQIEHMRRPRHPTPRDGIRRNPRRRRPAPLCGRRSTGAGSASGKLTHQREVAAVETDTVALQAVACEEPELILAAHILRLVDRGRGLTQDLNVAQQGVAQACQEIGRHNVPLDATSDRSSGNSAPVRGAASHESTEGRRSGSGGFGTS